MGKYTAMDNPGVDRYIDDLISKCLKAITDKVSPRAIILYGSLARGEASVIVSGEKVRMLSDCEIRVVDSSPRMRRICSDLTRELTAKLGVDISIAWMLPERINPKKQRDRFFRQPSPPSIFTYEFTIAGKTLYGEELFSKSALVDPAEIPLQSGILLLLNRMAESLLHLPWSTASVDFSREENIIWINKAVLACVEGLLVSEKSYHYSYEERYGRFAVLSQKKWGDLVKKVPVMPEFVLRATEFKLRPNLDLYPENLEQTWAHVAKMLDSVLRYLIALEYDICIDSQAGFTEQYLNQLVAHKNDVISRLDVTINFIVQKIIEGLKYLEQKRWPPVLLFTPYLSSQVVYALIPALFQYGFNSSQENSLVTVRKWLTMMGRLEPKSNDVQFEWNILCRQLTRYWKIFCY